MHQFQRPSRGEVLIVTSTIEGVWQIIPDADPPLQTRTSESSGEDKIVSIAAGQIGSAPTVKPRRKRVREKNIQAKDPSELKWLDPNWLDLLGVLVEGLIGVIRGKFVVQAHTIFDVNPPCTRCHSDKFVTKWSIRRNQSRNIKDAERNTKLVLIVLIVQRYFCSNCKKPFTPPLPFLADGHLSHTQRLDDQTKTLTLERQTSSALAVRTGLSRRAVQDIARKTAKTLPTPQEVFKKVTSDGKGHVVQIDDCHPSLGACTSFLLDGKPFHLLDGYSEAAIVEFLMTLDAEGRNNISVVVSDLAEFLLKLERRCFPCATVVADPYHVIRLLQKCFDEFLEPFEGAILAEYICALDDQRIVRPLRPKKGKRKKKVISEQNLSEMDIQKEEKNPRKPTAAEIRMLLHTRLGKTNDVQKKALTFLFTRFADVDAAYSYMQSVMLLFRTKEMVVDGRDASGLTTTAVKVIDARDASIELDKFEAMVPEHVRKGLVKFLDTCRKNRDVICAFWPIGWTNADIESQNDVIKEIDRAANGLQFEELRRRWLYGISMSAILGRDKEKVIGKKDGPQKKSTLELSTVPPPEPVPIEGKGGQLSLFG
jgi:transposase